MILNLFMEDGDSFRKVFKISVRQATVSESYISCQFYLLTNINLDIQDRRKVSLANIVEAGNDEAGTGEVESLGLGDERIEGIVGRDDDHGGTDVASGAEPNQTTTQALPNPSPPAKPASCKDEGEDSSEDEPIKPANHTRT